MKNLLTSVTSMIIIFVSSALAVPVFDSPVNYSSGMGLNAISAVDLDGDGDNDLVTSHGGSTTIGILLNNGDGTYQTNVYYSVGVGPTDLSAVDLDSDGDIDLAVSIYTSSSDNIAILLNNGNGTFQSAVYYTAGISPRSIYAANLDGDSDYDLVVANWTEDISVLINNGNGTFQPAADYPVGPAGMDGVTDVFAADLDGDGNNDVVVAHGFADSLYVLFNNGDGTLAASESYALTDGPWNVIASDFNSDGDLDLAATLPVFSVVAILLNNGDGTFQSPSYFSAGEDPRAIAAADLDCDGDNDLVVADFTFGENLHIFENNGWGTFQPAGSYTTGPGSAYAVAIADLDGNGNLDLAVADFNTFVGEVSVLLNLLPACQQCACCTASPGDLDGSGTTDVADLSYIVDYLFRAGPGPVCQ